MLRNWHCDTKAGVGLTQQHNQHCRALSYQNDLLLCNLYAGFHTCKSADATFLLAPCLNPQCHSLRPQQLSYLATLPPPSLPAGWEGDVATSSLHKFAPNKIINTLYRPSVTRTITVTTTTYFRNSQTLSSCNRHKCTWTITAASTKM